MIFGVVFRMMTRPRIRQRTEAVTVVVVRYAQLWNYLLNI